MDRGCPAYAKDFFCERDLHKRDLVVIVPYHSMSGKNEDILRKSFCSWADMETDEYHHASFMGWAYLYGRCFDIFFLHLWKEDASAADCFQDGQENCRGEGDPRYGYECHAIYHWSHKTRGCTARDYGLQLWG